MSPFRRWRRARIARRPFPRHWQPFLSGIPLFAWLPPEDQRELLGHIQVFLAEKKFEGAAGFRVDDRVRVTVAGNASLLFLHREADYFPFLRTVVVYPTLYVARYARPGPGGVMEEGMEVRAGESWTLGVVVLAWEKVCQCGLGPGRRNVVVHEFAHQLDLEDGAMQGVPALPSELIPLWADVFFREFQTIRVWSPLVPALGNPAEFFAVAVEAFFSDPWTLKEFHPELYRVLSLYFRQDPARLVSPWQF